jgi:GNAT superfamily N-acetyltransferase
MIREMQTDDCGRVSELLEQLGYPTPVDSVLDRYRRLDPSRNRLFVAEWESRVVGWAHAEWRRSITSVPRVEIVALVVDASHRRRGFGRALLGRIDEWAREAGVGGVRVSSNLARSESHAFYLRAGFHLTKTSAVYTKPVGPEA